MAVDFLTLGCLLVISIQTTHSNCVYPTRDHPPYNYPPQPSPARDPRPWDFHSEVSHSHYPYGYGGHAPNLPEHHCYRQSVNSDPWNVLPVGHAPVYSPTDPKYSIRYTDPYITARSPRIHENCMPVHGHLPSIYISPPVPESLGLPVSSHTFSRTGGEIIHYPIRPSPYPANIIPITQSQTISTPSCLNHWPIIQIIEGPDSCDSAHLIESIRALKPKAIIQVIKPGSCSECKSPVVEKETVDCCELDKNNVGLPEAVSRAPVIRTFVEPASCPKHSPVIEVTSAQNPCGCPKHIKPVIEICKAPLSCALEPKVEIIRSSEPKVKENLCGHSKAPVMDPIEIIEIPCGKEKFIEIHASGLSAPVVEKIKSPVPCEHIFEIHSKAPSQNKH